MNFATAHESSNGALVIKLKALLRMYSIHGGERSNF